MTLDTRTNAVPRVAVIKEWVNAYSDYLRATKNYTYGTIARFRYDVRRFLRWLVSNHFTLEEATSRHLQDYLHAYKTSVPYKRNIWTAFGALKLFFRFAVEAERLKHDLTREISCSWLDFPGGFPAYQGILRKLYDHPGYILRYRLPLFAPHWEEFLKEQIARGYAKNTLRHLIAHNFFFHKDLVACGVQSIAQVRPGHLDNFFERFQVAFQKRNGHPLGNHWRRQMRRDIRHFMLFAFKHQRRHFRPPEPLRTSKALPKALIWEFLDYCRVHRGLKETTLNAWIKDLVKLRNFLEFRRIPCLQDVTVAVLDAFFLSQSKRMDPKSVASIISTMRAFFNYLYLHNLFPFDIAKRLPRPCRFQRDRYPKYLPWIKVQELLTGINQNTPSGLRDYAILSLLAHHGLRPCEAARLHLADIDWESNVFTLRERKNGTTVKLPLAPHVQEAMQRYVSVRPTSSDPHLFLRVRAPFTPLLKSEAMASIAAKHLRKRFGKTIHHHGAYLFRHSFARALLDRGATLPEISAMLGHRNLESTFVYTQIDTEGLREASDNYADLL